MTDITATENARLRYKQAIAALSAEYLPPHVTDVVEALAAWTDCVRKGIFDLPRPDVAMPDWDKIARPGAVAYALQNVEAFMDDEKWGEAQTLGLTVLEDVDKWCTAAWAAEVCPDCIKESLTMVVDASAKGLFDGILDQVMERVNTWDIQKVLDKCPPLTVDTLICASCAWVSVANREKVVRNPGGPYFNLPGYSCN